MEKRFVAPFAEAEQQTPASAYHHHGEKRALRRRAKAALERYSRQVPLIKKTPSDA